MLCYSGDTDSKRKVGLAGEMKGHLARLGGGGPGSPRKRPYAVPHVCRPADFLKLLIRQMRYSLGKIILTGTGLSSQECKNCQSDSDSRPLDVVRLCVL